MPILVKPEFLAPLKKIQDFHHSFLSQTEEPEASLLRVVMGQLDEALNTIKNLYHELKNKECDPHHVDKVTQDHLVSLHAELFACKSLLSNSHKILDNLFKDLESYFSIAEQVSSQFSQLYLELTDFYSAIPAVVTLLSKAIKRAEEGLGQKKKLVDEALKAYKQAVLALLDARARSPQQVNTLQQPLQEQEHQNQITKQEEARKAFDGEPNPSLQQLEQKKHAIRQSQFTLGRRITESKVQETKQLLEKLHEYYRVLNSDSKEVLPPIVVLPFQFFIKQQFLESLKPIQKLNIRFLKDAKAEAWPWGPALKLYVAGLAAEIEDIEELAQALSDVECAPGQRSEETEKNLFLFISAVKDFQDILNILQWHCEDYGHHARYNDEKKLFQHYAAFLKTQLHSMQQSVQHDANSALVLHSRLSITLLPVISEVLQNEIQEVKEKRAFFKEEVEETKGIFFTEYSMQHSPQSSPRSHRLAEAPASSEADSSLAGEEDELKKEEVVFIQAPLPQPSPQKVGMLLTQLNSLCEQPEQPQQSPQSLSPYLNVVRPDAAASPVRGEVVFIQPPQPQRSPEKVDMLLAALHPRKDETLQQVLSDRSNEVRRMGRETQSVSEPINPSVAGEVARVEPIHRDVDEGKANTMNAASLEQQPQGISKNQIDTVVASIREKRQHKQKWFTKLLSFLGLNLRATKETLTGQFTDFLLKKYGKEANNSEFLTQTECENYLKRFKEAQQYLEQKRPSKHDAGKMVQNALAYIKSDGLKKDSLLPGFKSKKALRDLRSQHGFEKETRRYEEARGALRLRG